MTRQPGLGNPRLPKRLQREPGRQRMSQYNAWALPATSCAVRQSLVPEGYRVVVWESALLRPLPGWVVRIPKGEHVLRRVRNLIFYWLWQLCSHSGYLIVALLDGYTLAHYTVIRGHDFRFPWMGPRDLQVGSWTHPLHRRRGLASAALSIALSIRPAPEWRLWWTCRRDNVVSNNVARHQGLVVMSRCSRMRRFGTNLFGYFALTDVVAPSDIRVSSSVSQREECEQFGYLP